jgi:hypothetical protein
MLHIKRHEAQRSTEMLVCKKVAKDPPAASVVDSQNEISELSVDSELTGAARTHFRSTELAQLRAAKRKRTLMDGVLAVTNDYTQASLSSVVMSSLEPEASAEGPAMSSEGPTMSEAITFDDPDAGCFIVETHLLQDDMPVDNDMSYINGDDDDDVMDNFYLKTEDDDVFYTGTTINLHDLE